MSFLHTGTWRPRLRLAFTQATCPRSAAADSPATGVTTGKSARLGHSPEELTGKRGHNSRPGGGTDTGDTNETRGKG